ncbi:hypothetical protein BGZ95_009263, partial [Linnemannia exigua]
EGGGVDVVVFEVNEAAGQTRRLKEIGRMRSEDCGLNFLEAKFETYLERKLRKYRRRIPALGWETCMNTFRYVIFQPGYSPTHDEECYLQIPPGCGMDSLTDSDIGLEDELLCMPAEELKAEVFEPAVGDVLELIQDLLQGQQRLGRKSKAIFMVGEFGSSQYLLERVRQEFKDHVELVAAPLRPSLNSKFRSSDKNNTNNNTNNVSNSPRHLNVYRRRRRLPPALTGGGAGNHQQTLRAPQTHTSTSALASTPSTKINGLTPYSFPIVMAFDFGRKFMRAEDNGLHSLRIGTSGQLIQEGVGRDTYKAYAEVAKSPKDYCMLRNFRLQLDETIEVPPFENGFTPLKVITDYLRKLHEYAVEEVLKNMFSEFKPDTFQYVLTVPARWSNRSRNTMRQAAIGAGLVETGDPSKRLMVLTEDDANAMYCLRKIDGIQFKDKDRFIMCDASEGGGVDVVVYEVGESSAGQAQRLQEVARTHSSDCGSDFLEANIETYLERKLRKHRKIIKARAWELLMHDFWNVVRVIFKPAHDEEYVYLPFPSGTIPEYNPDIGLEDGVICFSREDLTEVFEPATTDVLEVI